MLLACFSLCIEILAELGLLEPPLEHSLMDDIWYDKLEYGDNP
jgi:hypothetical protein